MKVEGVMDRKAANIAYSAYSPVECGSKPLNI
jgi:hypothetical protein